MPPCHRPPFRQNQLEQHAVSRVDFERDPQLLHCRLVLRGTARAITVERRKRHTHQRQFDRREQSFITPRLEETKSAGVILGEITGDIGGVEDVVSFTTKSSR
jgi:hypothetical protein